MRNKDIAAALGLSKGTVSTLISRGMPTTNLDDIQLWREAHLKLRPKREETPAPVIFETISEWQAALGKTASDSAGR